VGSSLQIVIFKACALVFGREPARDDLDLIDRLQRNDVEHRPVVALLTESCERQTVEIKFAKALPRAANDGRPPAGIDLRPRQQVGELSDVTLLTARNYQRQSSVHTILDHSTQRGIGGI